MKLNKRSGISLVVLVITIIVMIILAGTVILSISNTEIIDRANEAKDAQDEATKKYQNALDYANIFIEGLAYTQNKTSITRRQGQETITLAVGDTVNYNEAVKDDGSAVTGLKDVNWKVLGVENGKLLLVSDVAVDLFTVHPQGISRQEAGNQYIHIINTLNSKCAPYGKGKYAIGARSITVEDVNRITGYNPLKTGNGKAYKDGEEGEYGNEITYTIDPSNYIAISTTNGLTGIANGSKNGTLTEADTACSTFELPNGKVLGKDMQSITVKSTYYRYWANTLTSDLTGATLGLDIDSPAHEMLFENLETDHPNNSCWLASQYQYTRIGRVVYGLLYTRLESGTGKIDGFAMFQTNKEGSHSTQGIRAVVEVDPYAILEPAGANAWTLK